MRLLIDENVAQQVVDRLRTDGFDVLCVREQASGTADPDVIALALAEGRIILTEDKEFSDLVVRKGYAVVGLVLLELPRLSPSAQAMRVSAALIEVGLQLQGSVVVIEPGRMRSRPLPARPA
jgi:predicted nuclease of predicted toxin-antitoxin system